MSYTPPPKFNVPLFLLIPTYTKTNGVVRKTYQSPSNELMFFGSFRTFGGTDVVENGVFSVKSTATIDTWFRPDITRDCRIARLNTDGTTFSIFEIIGEPENINMANQFLKIRVESIAGKS